MYPYLRRCRVVLVAVPLVSLVLALASCSGDGPQPYTPAYPPQTYTPTYPPQTYTPTYPPQTYTPTYPPQTNSLTDEELQKESRRLERDYMFDQDFYNRLP